MTIYVLRFGGVLILTTSSPSAPVPTTAVVAQARDGKATAKGH